MWSTGKEVHIPHRSDGDTENNPYYEFYIEPFTFHTGQMETPEVELSLEILEAVHIPHRSDGDKNYVIHIVENFTGSHSTQVRWRR